MVSLKKINLFLIAADTLIFLSLNKRFFYSSESHFGFESKIYIASVASFYRILAEENLLTHRSKAQPKRHKRPEALVAVKPNQVWTWDITYVPIKIKGLFNYIYLIVDVFSRKIIHGIAHDRQGDDLAAIMITEACNKENIARGDVTLHADNGAPMKGSTMLATLQYLGIVSSFSRPGISDDNPYSEALFKTLKYCPQYPVNGFESLDECRIWLEKFIFWYNEVHFHSGIQWVTPASRHNGEDREILNKRDKVYKTAREKKPVRWAKNTKNWSRTESVSLNPTKSKSPR